jgi:hypothetical protein
MANEAEVILASSEESEPAILPDSVLIRVSMANEAEVILASREATAADRELSLVVKANEAEVILASSEESEPAILPDSVLIRVSTAAEAEVTLALSETTAAESEATAAEAELSCV